MLYLLALIVVCYGTYHLPPVRKFVQELVFMIGLVQFTMNVWMNLSPEMQEQYGSPQNLYQELVFTHEKMVAAGTW